MAGESKQADSNRWPVRNLLPAHFDFSNRMLDHRPVKRCHLSLALLSLFLLPGCYSGSHPSRVGSVAPDFTVQDSDLKVTLRQFRGSVVVLNFWATWCPPCLQELPSMISMQARMRAKGVTVLAVSIDVDENMYHRFLKERGVNLLTVRDPEQKTASLYGTFGWPETYIIDRTGVLRRKLVGPVDWNSPEITDYLSKL
jgi:cytochrome c biogenesis protein CcmG/thiol:disulfide interchange protein DsbE